MTPVQL